MSIKAFYFVTTTMAAAMLIWRVVRLLNGHSLDSVLEMSRVERCGIPSILTALSVLYAIEYGDVAGWSVVIFMAVITGLAFWRSFRSRATNPPGPNPDAPSESN
jgi:hypothetical protein